MSVVGYEVLRIEYTGYFEVGIDHFADLETIGKLIGQLDAWGMFTPGRIRVKEESDDD